MDSVELGPYGIKYDRELLLTSNDEDRKIVTTNTYHAMGCLRQSLKGSKLLITTEFPERLTEKGMPESLTLEMDINPETDLTGEWIEC